MANNNNNKLPTVDFQLIFVKYNGNSLSWSQPSLVCLSQAIGSSEATQGVMFSYASSVPWNQQLRFSQTQETPKRFSNMDVRQNDSGPSVGKEDSLITAEEI